MKNRWLNLLFFLLIVLIASLSWHLFVFAKATAAASLIINILKPLNILLFVVLFYVLSRNLVKLYLGRKTKAPGFRLRTRLVLAILPLTLVPALLLFTFSTRFIDDILFNLVIDPNTANLVEASESLNNDYMNEVRTLHHAHGPELVKLMEGAAETEVAAYLARFGLQGVELHRDEGPVRIFAPDFPEENRGRVIETADPALDPEPVLYQDGFFISRFSYPTAEGMLQFLYTRNTPFTEKFLFVRDSYSYLKHAERKTEKVKGLNQGILLVTTLSVIFGGIWIGLAFANRFLAAFNILIAGARQVSQGNLETQIELETGDELEDVVMAFNSMTRTLKSNQAELQQKALDLERVNAELSGQIQYNQTLLQQINAGILSVDKEARVQTCNPAALAILDLAPIEGAPLLEDLLDPKRHGTLREQWNAFHRGQGGSFRQLELFGADGFARYVASSIVALRKEDHPFGSILVLEDLTQLLKAQKLAAWQEVAKRVAHEIKNPLTPIQLSIQRIQRKAQTDAPDLKVAIESAYETVMSETDLLKNLVNEFSTFAKMPAPVKQPTDLAELVRNVCEGYAPIQSDTSVRALIPEKVDFAVSCDPSQIRQVLSNLIQNALQASPKGAEVSVELERNEQSLLLSVDDQGEGIPRAERDQVFIPYYSKSPKGTGLGLAIVKRIIEDHGGRIDIHGNRPKGARFVISLPIP